MQGFDEQDIEESPIFSLEDSQFMRRALELARRGAGAVSPNPMVGCVIVSPAGLILGEGWHERYGGPHAEVNAVAASPSKDAVQGATIYVTLEPCTHFGKTPPCADLLIALKPRRVVVACPDPNPIVSGKGLDMLAKAGIMVDVGLLEDESLTLNRRFFTNQIEHRPYVTLKWAQTQDGFVARPDYSSKWITGPLSRALGHKLRAEEDAILVGFNTALHDDPRLDVRLWTGRSPLRAVYDPEYHLPASLNLLAGEDGARRLIITYAGAGYEQEGGQRAIVRESRKSGIAPPGLLEINALEDEPDQILELLYKEKVGSLLVEGGAGLLRLFLEHKCWDEAHVFTAPDYFGNGIAAPTLPCPPSEVFGIGQDQLLIYRNPEKIIWNLIAEIDGRLKGRGEE